MDGWRKGGMEEGRNYSLILITLIIVQKKKKEKKTCPGQQAWQECLSLLRHTLMRESSADLLLEKAAFPQQQKTKQWKGRQRSTAAKRGPGMRPLECAVYVQNGRPLWLRRNGYAKLLYRTIKWEPST